MLVPEINKRRKIKNQNTIFINDNDYGTIYNYDIITDEKKLDKFIKSIEVIIRSSYEYFNYINILKKELNYDHCTFFPKLNIEDCKFRLEFHHYPFTLYDLVAIEVKDLLNNEMYDINPFDIANDVLKYHYQNIVGLVPLSVTVHKLVHDGQKFINKKYIIGEYMEYVKKNMNRIDDSYLDKLHEIDKLSEMEDNGVNIDNNLLDINILNVIQEDITEELKPLKLNIKNVG